jgi:hypothetical protein
MSYKTPTILIIGGELSHRAIRPRWLRGQYSNTAFYEQISTAQRKPHY